MTAAAVTKNTTTNFALPGAIAYNVTTTQSGDYLDVPFGTVDAVFLTEAYSSATASCVSVSSNRISIIGGTGIFYLLVIGR